MSRISTLLSKAGVSKERKPVTSGNRKFPPISREIMKRLEEMRTLGIPHKDFDFSLSYDYEKREFTVEDTYTGDILFTGKGMDCKDWCYEQLHPERKEGTENFLTKEQLRETEVNSVQPFKTAEDINALEGLFANKDTVTSDVEDMSEDVIKLDDNNYQYFTNSVPSASLYFTPENRQVEVVFFDKDVNSEGQEYYTLDNKQELVDFIKKNTDTLDEMELINALKYMDTLKAETPEIPEEEPMEEMELPEEEPEEGIHNQHTKEFLSEQE